MSMTINSSYSVQVLGGPTLAGSFELEQMDAYVHISTIIPNDKNDITIEVPEPGNDVELLVIAPSKKSDGLSYARENGNMKPLNGPIVLIGHAAIELFGDKIRKHTFKNEGSKPAEVTILIARTPPKKNEEE